MMSIAASFPSVKKPRFNINQERRDKRLKVMLASCNVEPAHTQTNTLLPTCDEVVNLTGLLETKFMSVSSGK
jgi:hypothetical protein